MRNAVGSVFTVVGWVGWTFCGFGGLALCLHILHSTAGFPGAALGFLLSPLTFIATPWFALAALGTWTPLLVCYAGGLLSTTLIGLGAGIRD
jgi:hypothetical protein